MAISQELIDEINELAAKKKAGTITEAELKQQKELRAEYIKQFRGNMRQILDNTDVVKEHKISKFNTTRKELEKLNNDDRIVRIEEKTTEFVITYKVNDIEPIEIMKLLKEN